MGNKSSSPENHSHKNPDCDASGIIREGRPPRKQVHSMPDVSDTAHISMDPGFPDNIKFSDNISMRFREAAQIDGKHVGGKSVFSSNPVLSDDDAYEDPRNFPDSPNSENVDVYWKTVDQVTSVWPEYGNIRDIDISSLSFGVRQTLQQILKRLFEQHSLIRRLSGEQHDVRQELSELREERDAVLQQLARRDRDVRALREDVFILRTELKRLGHDKSQTRQTTASEDHGSPDDAGSNAWQFTSENGRSDTKSDVLYDSDDAERFKRLKKERIYKPTPLLLAEGSLAESKKAIARTPSFRPTDNEQHSYNGHLSNEIETDASSVKEKLYRVESLLEKERKHNEILRQRLNSVETESNTLSISSLRPKKSLSLEECAERYRLLEAAALGRVASCLSKQLSHTTHSRQQQFSCAVMQKSYDVALSRVKQFKDVIKALITNPANPSVQLGAAKYGQMRALAGQISLFEHFKPGYGINHTSPLAKKTQVAEEIPEMITREIYGFLESMADVTNISDLVEGVVDNLRQEYGDCTTAALLNKSEFTDFLYDCCRFAWQISVPSQPLFVYSTGHWRYDERYHVSNGDVKTTNARIDFYIFPVLFSKKNGEVLHKGRVSIKI